MSDFAFIPPNRGALWSGLALTKTQLAELCGLTTRQISHWTSQGYITTSSHHPDRYNGDAIDSCVLIKQGLQHGIPLRRSVARARAYLASQHSQQPGLAAIPTPTLVEIRDSLQRAQASLDVVLQAVEARTPRQPVDEVLDTRAALN